MTAYLLCDVAVHDRDALLVYLELAKGTVESFGGRYLAQGGGISVLEGDWDPQAMIVVEFPSVDAAKDWYSSRAYAPALDVNAQAMVRNMILVEGLGLDD